MGKVAKPLAIVVFSPLDEWPEIVKLEKQGHEIIKLPDDALKYAEALGADIAAADIILGPRCWYMTELHRKHLTQAIKQARLRRYGTITKKRKKGDDNEENTNLEGRSGSGSEATGSKTTLETVDSSSDPESSSC